MAQTSLTSLLLSQISAWQLFAVVIAQLMLIIVAWVKLIQRDYHCTNVKSRHLEKTRLAALLCVTWTMGEFATDAPRLTVYTH